MTTTSSVLQEALEKRKREIHAQKVEKKIRYAVRIFLSLFIPCAVTFIVTFIANTFLGKFHGNTFSANMWFYFCKCFFPCLPFQVYYIVRKK